MTNNLPSYESKMGRIFQLTVPHHHINGKRLEFHGAIVMTPEAVSEEQLVIAWTYALRYSAKGLDYPDYEAALNLLIQRHPSWELIDRRAHIINPDFSKAIDDVPEG
jgi:hypothetical protein